MIPTHDRSRLLRGALDGLRAQTYPAGRLDVVVVSDAGRDDIVAMADGYRAPFSLRAIHLPERLGPAAARNAGAAIARGELLIFLDDDIEPARGLVEAHVSTHAGEPERVVIGYLPPLLDTQTGFFRITLRRWWEDKFDTMRQPGHRFHAFDLLSGNMALGAALFRRVGGFDPTLACHEDYELGVRLMRHGARFAFAPDAVGAHHEHTDLRRALARKSDEGRADVVIGRLHPWMRPELPLTRLLRMRSRRARAVLRAAFATAASQGPATAAAITMLRTLEVARVRRAWSRVLNDLLGYWYWRGVADALGTIAALQTFVSEPREDASLLSEVEIDLRAGPAAAELRLDAEQPAGARLVYGALPVGRILPRPGAEPLRGRHLRPAMARFFAAPLLDAMAQTGDIDAGFDPARLRLLCAARPQTRAHGIEHA